MHTFFRLTLLISAAFPWLCPAQDSIPVFTFKDNIVVTASRIPLVSSELSRSVTILDAQQIKHAPATAVPELLNVLAGIDVREQGPGGVHAHLHIRGTGYEQALILLDGAKLNDPQTGHHNMHLPVSYEQIERIEILKGAASRIYGPNAFGGAVNIITKKTRDKSVSIQTEYGEDHTYLGGVSLNTLYGNSAHRFSLSQSASDGYRTNTDYSILNGSYAMDFEQNRMKYNLYTGFTDKAFGANRFYGSSSEWQREDIRTFFMNTGLDYQGADYWVTGRIYWKQNRDHYIWDKFHPDWYENQHRTDILSLETQWSYRSSYGTTSIRNELSREQMESSNLQNHQRNRAGFILEHHARLTQQLMFIPGLSTFYYSEWGWQTWPGFDLEFRLNRYNAFYSTVNTAFRTPTYTEMFYNDPDNRGNAKLRAEEALTYEIGYRHDQPAFAFHSSMFSRQTENLIDWVWSPGEEVWQALNFNDITTNGAELQFTWRKEATGRFSVLNCQLSYMYLHSGKAERTRLSKYTTEHLRHQAAFRITINTGLRGLINTLSLRYEDRINHPGQILADTRFHWRLNNAELFMDIKNLFDRNYYDFYAVPLPGRKIRFGYQHKLSF